MALENNSMFFTTSKNAFNFKWKKKYSKNIMAKVNIVNKMIMLRLIEEKRASIGFIDRQHQNILF